MLSKISTKSNALDPCVLLRELTDDGPRIIQRRVVDEDNDVIGCDLAQRTFNTAAKLSEHGAAIVNRHDHSKFRYRLGWRRNGIRLLALPAFVSINRLHRAQKLKGLLMLTLVPQSKLVGVPLNEINEQPATNRLAALSFSPRTL